MKAILFITLFIFSICRTAEYYSKCLDNVPSGEDRVLIALIANNIVLKMDIAAYFIIIIKMSILLLLYLEV